MSNQRLERFAAVFLGVAVVVILVTPVMFADPNALAVPAALVTGIGVVGAWLGGNRGRRLGLVVGFAGVLFNGLWLWFASSGFGKGTPWVDDMIEAAGLLATFLVAVALLLRAGRGQTSTGTG